MLEGSDNINKLRSDSLLPLLSLTSGWFRNLLEMDLYRNHCPETWSFVSCVAPFTLEDTVMVGTEVTSSQGTLFSSS